MVQRAGQPAVTLLMMDGDRGTNMFEAEKADNTLAKMMFFLDPRMTK
jgi:hypothetical protein